MAYELTPASDPMSLANWLHAGAHASPSAPALLTPASAWTYAALADTARRGGAFLRAQGANTDTIVGIAGSASALAVGALACSAAQLALLPLDPQTAAQRWPALAALGGQRMKLLADALPGKLSAVLAPDSGEQPAVDSPHALALVIATSGSEGTPKAVMLTQGNLDAAAVASNLRLPLSAGDIWLGCLPLHHIGGMAILYRCMRAGATMLLHEGFDATAVWRDVRTQGVTHLSLVPTMLARLLDCAGKQAPPARLRFVLVGGAALPQSLFERAVNAGWPICPTWGMSECAAQAATLVLAGSNWQSGQVGTLLPGFVARIDEGERIHLRGPQLMAGYLNPQCLPGDGLSDGWLKTSDLGRLDKDGQLTILGRADDMLISGGVKIHPLEIETCLTSCPGVADVAVSALDDSVWGDLLVALVVGTADHESVDGWCRQKLSPAQRPRRILRVEQLPRNAMGKLERAALRQLAREAACG